MKGLRRSTKLLPILLAGILASSCSLNLFSMLGGKKGMPDQLASTASATGEFKPGAYSTGVALAATSQLRLGDRNYVKSLLEDIFGSSIELTLVQLVNPEYTVFGGACAFYSDCALYADGNARAAVVPAAISAREALRTRACNRIAATDAAVRHAAALALGEDAYADVSDWDPGWPPLTAGAQAYALFYPGREPSPAALNALNAIPLAVKTSASGASSLDAWRFLFLTLCLAPDWQVP